MSGLFDDAEHSELYLKYRPRYPDEVYELISDKLEQSYARLPRNESNEQTEDRTSSRDKKWKMALDVGCGTGISTLPLSNHFKQTFGIDGSKSQIFQAKSDYGMKDPSKVTFLHEDCSKLSAMFGESCADVITVAQALHWFDRPKFYEECRKVLKPGGLLVAYGFNLHEFDNEKDTEIFNEFYNTIKDYAEEGMFHVVDNYERIFPEFKEHFQSAERDDSLTLTVHSTLDEYAGYLSSWSFYRNYRAVNPDKDPLKTLYEKSKERYPDPSATIKRHSQIFMLFGRKA